jgi:hypothetical protein
MSQMIRRTVALAALTAALLFAVPAPSHAAHLRGAALDGPALTADLMTRALSWLQGLLGGAAPAATPQRPSAFQKDVTMMPVTPPPPGGTSGSGSMVDPDGKKGS